MTRKEILQYIKGELDNNENAEIYLDVDDYKIIVDALEQEPCEDCVSRQAVLERINDWWGITSTSGEPTLCDCIRDLPPVTPTRKKGKWITNSDFPDEIICSYCNTNYDMWFWEQGTMNYCPHCGAEMESEE